MFHRRCPFCHYYHTRGQFDFILGPILLGIRRARFDDSLDVVHYTTN